MHSRLFRYKWQAAIVLFYAALSLIPIPASGEERVLSGQELQHVVDEAYARYKGVREGKNADYIPELAKVPSDLFGVAVVTAKGDFYAAGDVNYTFALESVSKPFTAALVMQDYGSAEVIAEKIGVEPTGLPFNSILATQILQEVSVNPFVNAGAIAAVSLVKAVDAGERFSRILDFYQKFAADRLAVIEKIYQSESTTDQHNRAIAYILFSSGRIYSDPMETLDVYARQLAVMGATLANGGVNPISKKQVIDKKYIPKLLALMMTAGFYNESGMWSFTAGLPAKTGVGGGIVAIVPGRMAIVGFSPRLDKEGNSVRAAKAIGYISDSLELNIFGSGR